MGQLKEIIAYDRDSVDTYVQQLLERIAELESEINKCIEKEQSEEVIIEEPPISYTKGYRDLVIIPDKYNTGSTGALTEVSVAGRHCNLDFITVGSRLVLGFKYQNQARADETEIYIKDLNFTKVLEIYHPDRITVPKVVTFENCSFVSINGCAGETSKIKMIFKHCTIGGHGGGNAEFYKCKFGGRLSDCSDPSDHVVYKDCYFSDTLRLATRTFHLDGIQIYGRDGIIAKDIHVNNCRFEMPQYPIEGQASGCYVSACIAFTMDFNNAENCTFKDIIVNGGSKVVICDEKKYEIKNVSFSNVLVGRTMIYPNENGMLISCETPPSFTDVVMGEKLYVASVWRENGKIHLSVSNDTLQERTLIVKSSKERREFQIKGCYNTDELTAFKQYITFTDYPFDIDIEMEDAEWIVCYDTVEKDENQIRFEDFK